MRCLLLAADSRTLVAFSSTQRGSDMAYDANMTSIAKSMRSIALVFWCSFWVGIGLLFFSFVSWLVMMATIDQQMRQAEQRARDALRDIRR